MSIYYSQINPNIEAQTYGRHISDTPVNWSNVADPHTFGTIQAWKERHDVPNLFVPILDHEYSCTETRRVFFPNRYWSDTQTVLYHGAHGNVTTVLPGRAVLFRSADCPTVVITSCDSPNALVIHASRDLLLPDFEYQNARDIAAKSIIGRTLLELRHSSEALHLSSMHISVHLGIGSLSFTHPKPDARIGQQLTRLRYFLRKSKYMQGKNTKRIFDEVTGAIDLVNLIYYFAQEALDEELHSDQFFHDGVDTYSDRQYWSHRRFVDWQNNGGAFRAHSRFPQPRDRRNQNQIDGRNAVFVINRHPDVS